MIGRLVFFVLVFIPSIAEAASGISKEASSAFSYGPAKAMIHIMYIAIGGTILTYVTSAFGKGMLSNIIKLLTSLACISIVLYHTADVIDKIGKFLGM